MFSDRWYRREARGKAAHARCAKWPQMCVSVTTVSSPVIHRGRVCRRRRCVSENVSLLTTRTVLSVAVQGLSADVSALLLGPDGKVRGDHDLVFYNHPAQDGVSVEGAAVTADLPRLPADVHRVIVVVSADPLQPGAAFTRAPQLSIVQNRATKASFTAPDFTAGETVVVLAELYRRGDGWKVRAVGQGYASGLAGLATDYGVDVDPDPQPSAASLPAQTRTTGAHSASVDPRSWSGRPRACWPPPGKPVKLSRTAESRDGRPPST